MGDKIEEKPFYSYVNNEDGASSFLFRIDGDTTMRQTGILKINTLNNFIEIPKQIPNWHYLPKGTHSKYIDAPTYEEIIDYLEQNNFKIVEKINENFLEDNILFSNIKLNA